MVADESVVQDRRELRVVGCVVVSAGQGAGQPGWDVIVVAKVRVSTFFIADLSEEWV